MMQSSETLPALKKTGISKEMHPDPKNIRLDNLVVLECVSLMRQNFGENLIHQTVSRRFADAIQFSHSKIAISIIFDDLIARRNLIVKSHNVNRWAFHLFDLDNKKHMSLIFKNIFALFSEVCTLDLSNLMRHLDNSLLTLIIIALQRANLTKLKKLKISAFQNSYASYVLFREFSHLVKNIHVVSIYPKDRSFQYFFAALSQCSNLRKLRFSNIYVCFESEILTCLQTLKIRHLQVDKHE